MARRQITVPDLGDFKNVEVVELLVKPGDQVRAEQPLLTLETDKAAMEVPTPVAGTVIELKVAQGGRVSKGDLIAVLEAEEAGTAPVETAAPRRSSAISSTSPSTPAKATLQVPGVRAPGAPSP